MRMWGRGKRVPAADKVAPPNAHYWVISQTLNIYICVANHQCSGVRDRNGHSLKLEQKGA
jgi:hypothetical protein